MKVIFSGKEIKSKGIKMPKKVLKSLFMSLAYKVSRKAATRAPQSQLIARRNGIIEGSQQPTNRKCQRNGKTSYRIERRSCSELWESIVIKGGIAKGLD